MKRVLRRVLPVVLALLLLVAGLLVWVGVQESARPDRGREDGRRRGWALWGGILIFILMLNQLRQRFARVKV